MSQLPFLRTVALFAEFEPAELEAIAGGFQEKRFPAGATVLEEGSSNRAFHIVREGRVRVSRNVAGHDVILTDLLGGQTFGELSILEDGLATASLRAVTDTQILSLSMVDLAKFLRDSPVAAARFWRGIALDLRRRLLQTNDIVTRYFEVNRELIDNPTFREAYAMCNR